MDPHNLPVYKEKERILQVLAKNPVIVVESPTGSGKTTQLPIILHEAGYASKGMIGVTQPRRIASVSVSEYIAKQMGTPFPGLVGYKMRFEDKTTPSTKIKILTDGTLLQEIKADPMLHQYDVLMVDEAHERSLNIDFILGLLKNILKFRPEFKIIISSATINAEIFSTYFSDAPVVHIETQTFPVQMNYSPPAVEDDEVRVEKIVEIVAKSYGQGGDILVFLPGEKMIKEVSARLIYQPYAQDLHMVPLYGRLSSEEQERVFDPAPLGKTKVVLSTNIAETSVTIDGITVVIDSGLAKINHYNPRTFTSSLVESKISRASANQRKGRAGRTQPGTCWRLYAEEDFETRDLFTLEEIYRTDLSEVVLRMAELGITDFASFDFLSPPGRQGIIGAVETLNLLEALEEDNSLSSIGKMMVPFPLLPKHARIIVESIMKYPQALDDVLIGTSFLSTDSPYLLPQGEELEARRAHHQLGDEWGDFMSYLKIYKGFQAAPNKEKWCEKSYLDTKTMHEIVNIKGQLEEIVSRMGVPLGTGGTRQDYLLSIAKGLIQFVCMATGRGTFRSLTAEKILIHPGSSLFKETPPFIVAGEIVRTSRTYARSVSPLKKEWLGLLNPNLARNLASGDRSVPEKETGKLAPWQVQIGRKIFAIKTLKGKQKVLVLPWDELKDLADHTKTGDLPEAKNWRGRVELDGQIVMEGVKLEKILDVARKMDFRRDKVSDWPLGQNYGGTRLILILPYLEKLLFPAYPRPRSQELGFLSLQSDNRGQFWFKVQQSFQGALSDSLESVEQLADAVQGIWKPEDWKLVNKVYRRLDDLL